MLELFTRQPGTQYAKPLGSTTTDTVPLLGSELRHNGRIYRVTRVIPPHTPNNTNRFNTQVHLTPC